MIVVVGGGITGLALGHELASAGVQVRVYEAADRPGGVTWSEDRDGVFLDLGPQRTRLTESVRALVEELGLEGELQEAPPDLPLYVYRGGRLRVVPFSTWEAARTDLLSWRAKLRALLEPFTSPLYPRETVEEFFVRKFGREAYRSLLGPLYGGLYASDPGRMPARHALGRVLEEFGVGRSLLLTFLRRGRQARRAVPTVSFRGGMGALPRALARSLGERLRLGTPVRAVVPGPGGRLQVEASSEDPVEARAVVLTCPAPAAAGILRSVAGDAADRLETLTYNPLAVVHLRGAGCGLRGFGYQVAFGEELETRGVTWNASIFDRDEIYTAYLGGMKNPDLVKEEDDALGRIAAAEFAEATGCRARPLEVSRTRVPAWDHTWNGLEGIALPERIHLCAAYTGRPGIPGRIVAAKSLAKRLRA